MKKTIFLIMVVSIVLAACNRSQKNNEIVIQEVQDFQEQPEDVVEQVDESENVSLTAFEEEESERKVEVLDFKAVSGKPISLTEGNYGRENWEEIEKTFSEVYIKCTVDYYQDTPLISELYYYGTTNDEETILLGSFTKDTGLLNSSGQEFAGDREFRTGNDFYNENLLGLSIDCIDYPFSLYGVALTTDNEVYETETLCRLAINCDELTIEEWFPEL